MYFQVQKCSEHKTIFKMLPQSIDWKRLLCQHLFAFLGGQCEQRFYLPQAYSPVQVEKQIPQSTTVLTQGMENSITRLLSSGWEDRPQGRKFTHSANSHWKLSGCRAGSPNMEVTLGERQSPVNRTFEITHWVRKKEKCWHVPCGTLPILKNTINKSLYQEFKIFKKSL